MIVEYKEPRVKITQGVFDQVVQYNSVLKVPFIVVTNGLIHYCCRMDYEKMGYEYLTDIPTWGEEDLQG
jgi:type I site-specific restriction endonuclease